MSQRGVFAIALLVSLAAHAAAAWYWSAHDKSEGAGEQGQLHMPIKVVIAAMPAAAVVPQAQPEPKVVETPEPAVSEPPPLKQPPPLTHAKPVKAPPPQPANTQLPVDDTPLQPLSVAMAGNGAAPSAPAIDYEGLRESYRSQVLARIESFKHYPMAARRHRVEGDLEVDLNIACDGAVTSLNVEGAFGVLRSAAARSVTRAAPLPAPPPQLSCPHRLQYAMTYRLH